MRLFRDRSARAFGSRLARSFATRIAPAFVFGALLGVAAPAGAQDLDPSVLDDPRRPEAEVAQDEGRRVLEVYEWWGVEPGMTVADVFPGGGYNTHVLSNVVGPDGTVYGVLGFYEGLTFEEGATPMDERYRSRVAEDELENVEVVPWLDDVPAGSIDVAVLVRNYHDVEWVMKDWKGREEVVADLYEALKPGGVVGIVEVATDREGWDDETHRLNRSVVVEDFTAGGFELAGSSDLLADPDDDHTTTGFEAGRHTTDRYLLKFVKPTGS